MHPPSRKGILIVLLAILLVVAVAPIPDILSDEMRAWCLSTFGDGYQKYLLGFFVVGSIVLLFLTTDIAKWLRPGTQTGKPAPFNIPPGPNSRQVLDQANKAIASGEPDKALQILSGLKLPALSAEIELLSSRWAHYQRTRIHATEAPDAEGRIFKKISRDTRDLIALLEKELATSTGNYDTIRTDLKKRYTNRLDQKLAKRQPVNLRRIPSTEGTSLERVTTFAAYNSEEIGGTMAQIFREGRGRLLLLGKPGSGKTVLMLQLVLELLESEPDAMPVLLNLATWDKDFISLDAWLKKILPAELRASDRLAAEIIQQNRLILLLDGFDEIKEDDRVSCLDAIGRYGEDGQRRYAISSRKQEYFGIAKDAPVESQIEVGPLSTQQLETELQRLWSDSEKPERGARMLWNAIQENELLRTVVETPFYFNALQILFGGSKTLSELQLTGDSLKELQAQITERFVEYELEGARVQYPPERSAHWLSFLASRMNERNMVVFELRDLQYDWWSGWTRKELGAGEITYGVVVELLTKLISGLIFGILIFLLSGIRSWLLFPLVLPMFWGILNVISERAVLITTKDNIALPKGIVIKLIKEILFGVLFSMFILGEGLAFIGLFAGHPTNTKLTGALKNVFGKIISPWQEWLSLGLFVGFFFGLVIGALSSLLNLLSYTNDSIQITSPYHRFNASIKALHFSILQHKLLSYQLRKKGLLPPNLVGFLNEMARRHLLEFDGDLTTGTGGGSWRFRHRILQEYFAERWVEPEERLPSDLILFRRYSTDKR